LRKDEGQNLIFKYLNDVIFEENSSFRDKFIFISDVYIFYRKNLNNKGADEEKMIDEKMKLIIKCLI